MKATLLGSNEFELKQAVEFPFLEYELSKDGAKLWVRNGKVLDESGRFIAKGTITSINEFAPIDAE